MRKRMPRRVIYASMLSLLLLVVGLLLAQIKQAITPPAHDSTKFQFCVESVGDSAILLDRINGGSWILQYRTNDSPTWFPLPSPNRNEDMGKWKTVQETEQPAPLTHPPVVTLPPSLEKDGYIKIQVDRTLSGYLSIKAKINDKHVTLALDTASPQTRLDRKRTEALQIQWQGDSGTPGKTSSAEPTARVVLPSIEIGPFRTGRLLVGQHDLTELNSRLAEHYGDPPFDGILGADVLERYSAIIDFGKLELFISNSESGK
jgi:hypothetical protein